VTQVSHQTRIGETIITGIEGDDYSACGGDFYAHGLREGPFVPRGQDGASMAGLRANGAWRRSRRRLLFER
jgi:hypothetical protein